MEVEVESDVVNVCTKASLLPRYPKAKAPVVLTTFHQCKCGCHKLYASNVYADPNITCSGETMTEVVITGLGQPKGDVKLMPIKEYNELKKQMMKKKTDNVFKAFKLKMKPSEAKERVKSLYMDLQKQMFTRSKKAKGCIDKLFQKQQTQRRLWLRD